MNGQKSSLRLPPAVRSLAAKILPGILLITLVGVIAFAALFCVMFFV